MTKRRGVGLVTKRGGVGRGGEMPRRTISKLITMRDHYKRSM